MSADVQVFREGGVAGYRHVPAKASGDGLVLTHGAGGDATSKLLDRTASAFAERGFTVLRIDLPFRQARKHGPPPFGGAAKDRANLREAADLLRASGLGRVFIGGQSYGGRQCSMLAAEDAEAASGLLLLSYPLHAPGKTQMRTAHFPGVRVPALFVQGDRDPFGKPEELRTAIEMIAGPVELSVIDHAGHDLRSGDFDMNRLVIEPFERLINSSR